MSTTPQSSSAAGPVRAPLFVDVVSDVVCPWCYIGKRKLETALSRLRVDEPGLSPTVRWHPFELNPDLPVEGMPRAAYLEDRKSTRLNSSHSQISYAVFCLKKKKTH